MKKYGLLLICIIFCISNSNIKEKYKNKLELKGYFSQKKVLETISLMVDIDGGITPESKLIHTLAPHNNKIIVYSDGSNISKISTCRDRDTSLDNIFFHSYSGGNISDGTNIYMYFDTKYKKWIKGLETAHYEGGRHQPWLSKNNFCTWKSYKSNIETISYLLRNLSIRKEGNDKIRKKNGIWKYRLLPSRKTRFIINKLYKFTPLFLKIEKISSSKWTALIIKKISSCYSENCDDYDKLGVVVVHDNDKDIWYSISDFLYYPSNLKINKNSVYATFCRNIFRMSRKNPCLYSNFRINLLNFKYIDIEKYVVGSSIIHDLVLYGDKEALILFLNNKKNIDINIKNISGITPLHYAIKDENIEIIDLLIKHGANVDEYGWFYLHNISYNGYLEIASILINSGAKINVKDPGGKTPLHLAIFGGHLRMVSLLLKHEAKVNEADKDGKTPLHLAISGGHLRMVSLLLKHEAKVNEADKDGKTPLHLASSGGHLKMVSPLLKHEAKVNEADKDGKTPLHLASSGGHLKMVSLLLKHEAKVNEADKDGKTPLHLASSGGHLKMVSLLLKHEAKVNEADKDGKTPLHLASSGGHLKMVSLLLKHEAKVNEADKDGKTPLHLASSGGHLKMVSLLLKHEAEVNETDKDGQTSLYLASSNGHLGVTLLLMNHGAKANAKNKDGQTSLYLASSNGHLGVTLLLMNHGAKANAKNKDGQTPLHLASSNGHLEIVALLLKYGSKVNIKNRNGQTSLHLASSGGHLEVVSLLLKYGSKVNTKDRDGEEPLHLAISNDHLKIASLLMKDGDKSFILKNNIKKENGNKLLGYFSQKKFLEKIILINDNDNDSGAFAPSKLFHIKKSFYKKKIIVYSDGSNISEMSTCRDRETGLDNILFHSHAGGNISDGTNIAMYFDIKNEKWIKGLETYYNYGENHPPWLYKKGLCTWRLHKSNLENLSQILKNLEIGGGSSKEISIPDGSWKFKILQTKGSKYFVDEIYKFPSFLVSIERNSSMRWDLFVINKFISCLNEDCKDKDYDGNGIIIIYDNKENIWYSILDFLYYPSNIKINKNIVYVTLCKNIFEYRNSCLYSNFRINLLNFKYIDIGKYVVGNSIIHDLVLNGDKERLTSYLGEKKNRKININIKNISGSTPLHYAVKDKNIEIVNFLIKHGANVNILDEHGWSPLHNASYNGYLEISSMLISSGSKINLMNDISKNNKRIYKSQEESSSNFKNNKNTWQTTPLHLAISRDHMDVVSVLLKKGAKVNIKDKDGQAPLHLASSHGYLKMVSLLLEHGAKINIKDKNKQTPLDLARLGGHLEVESFLFLLKRESEAMK